MNTQEIFIPIQNYTIQADLYEGFSEQKNVIVMAHGLGGEKKAGLLDFAQFYAEQGYSVCIFDHRGFGQSTGKIKNLVDKNSQIEDWKTVVHYLKNQFQILASNMILWGYSFSGGHVLTLASKQNYKAIIANFPHIDGLASLALYPKKYLIPATLLSLQDLAYATINRVKTMPVVAQNRFAILAGEDCFDGYKSIIPQNLHWENAVPARIVATIGLYRPITTAQIIESPTFIVGATNDSLIPIQATRKTAKKIKNGYYFEEQCGHFDLFHEPFKKRILDQHLKFLGAL